MNRFKPLLDAFQGSFKDKYYYWLGIQVSLRSLFFVFYILHTQIKLLISTIVLLCYTLSFGYLYPNRSKIVNIQELLLLLNLTMTYAVSCQSRDKIFSIFTNIMVTTVFIKFCLIILSHIITYSLHCDLISVLKAKTNKITWFKKSEQFCGINSSLQIPDRAYNYTEYRDGFVSNDFRCMELTEFTPKNDNN